VLSEDYLIKRDKRESLPTKFDVGPQGQANMPRVQMPAGGTGGAAAAAIMMGGIVPYGVPGAVPPALMYGGMMPNMGLLGGGGSSQQQTRHARRVYVGGITEAHGTDQEISNFFETTLRSCLSDKDTPAEGAPLIGRVYLHAERGFAFLEFPSIQMTSACMQLNRLVWKGTPLKVSFGGKQILLFCWFVLPFVRAFVLAFYICPSFFNTRLSPPPPLSLSSLSPCLSAPL
jgi:hypothetical protein